MTRRTTTWWQGVAEAADAPEPWADIPHDAPALTDDQRAVLAGLDDQPDAPHLDGWAGDDDLDPGDQPAIPRWRAGNGTGNAPGDAAPARPYRARRWMETELNQ